MSSRNKSQIELQKLGELPSAQVLPNPCCVQPFSVRTDAVSELYNMDCVEGMKHYPDNYFDLAICDPPYGMNVENSTSRESTSKHGGRKAYEFKGWDKDRPPYEYFIELFRVSKNQIIWGANYFAEHLPPSMGWIFWDKGQRICNSDGELAYTSFNKALRVVEANRCKIIEYGGAIHPTQKPYYLYAWILNNYAQKGQRILDTHVGSGSSRIACHHKGFDFVGFEIDLEYCEKSEKRFVDAISQQRLF
jgi:site-specific DNA-methyltransferase (adenine-specific)